MRETMAVSTSTDGLAANRKTTADTTTAPSTMSPRREIFRLRWKPAPDLSSFSFDRSLFVKDVPPRRGHADQAHIHFSGRAGLTSRSGGACALQSGFSLGALRICEMSFRSIPGGRAAVNFAHQPRPPSASLLKKPALVFMRSAPLPCMMYGYGFTCSTNLP